MFRCLGFIIGLVLSIGIALLNWNASSDPQLSKLLLTAGILNIITFFLFFIFIFLSKNIPEFGYIYAITVAQWIANSTECLSQTTVLPEYETISVYYSGRIQRSQTNNTCIWGIVEGFFFILVGILTFISLLFLIPAYIAALVMFIARKRSEKYEQKKAQRQNTQENIVCDQIPKNIETQLNYIQNQRYVTNMPRQHFRDLTIKT